MRLQGSSLPTIQSLGSKVKFGMVQVFLIPLLCIFWLMELHLQETHQEESNFEQHHQVRQVELPV